MARLEQKSRGLVPLAVVGLFVLTSVATAVAEPAGKPLLDLKAGTGDSYLRLLLLICPHCHRLAIPAGRADLPTDSTQLRDNRAGHIPDYIHDALPPGAD